MFKRVRAAARHIACVVAVTSSLSLSAQTTARLRIGDQAPSLKYSKWIKGTPVKSFSGDQLYVVEFWATWCGPCKAAMPGLTKLAKEYAGKATFIGANVWEKIKDGQTYEAALPSVVKFVEGNKVNMGYEVIADNNEQHLGNNWLKAAGINGIPSTFVIKNNQIIWIGHPMALDSMMPVFLSGKYNMKEYSAGYYKAEANSAGQQLANITAPIDEAIKAKKYTEALELANKALSINSAAKMLLDRQKFHILLRVNEAEAIKHVENMLKDKASASNAKGVLGMDINDCPGLSPGTYLFGAGLVDEAITTQRPPVNPLAYDILASLYAKGNNYEKAVTNQQKAIDALKAFPQEQLPPGMSVENNLPELQKKLDTYKKAVKN